MQKNHSKNCKTLSKSQQQGVPQESGADFFGGVGEEKESGGKNASAVSKAVLRESVDSEESTKGHKTASKAETSKFSAFWRIFNVIAGVVLVAFTLLILFSVYSAKLNNKPVYVLGYTFSIVVTDSMSPEINVGDFVISKKADIKDIKVGDNVLFTCLSGALQGNNIIHRAVSINEDGSIVTKGVKSGATVDDMFVTADNLVGKEVWQSTALGNVVMFFSSVTNWIFILVISVTFVLIIKIVKKLILTLKSEKK